MENTIISTALSDIRGLFSLLDTTYSAECYSKQTSATVVTNGIPILGNAFALEFVRQLKTSTELNETTVISSLYQTPYIVYL